MTLVVFSSLKTVPTENSSSQAPDPPKISPKVLRALGNLKNKRHPFINLYDTSTPTGKPCPPHTRLHLPVSPVLSCGLTLDSKQRLGMPLAKRAEAFVRGIIGNVSKQAGFQSNAEADFVKNVLRAGPCTIIFCSHGRGLWLLFASLSFEAWEEWLSTAFWKVEAFNLSERMWAIYR